MALQGSDKGNPPQRTGRGVFGQSLDMKRDLNLRSHFLGSDDGLTVHERPERSEIRNSGSKRTGETVHRWIYESQDYYVSN